MKTPMRTTFLSVMTMAVNAMAVPSTAAAAPKCTFEFPGECSAIDANGEVVGIATGEFGPRFGEYTVTVNSLVAESTSDMYVATVCGPSEGEVLSLCMDLFFGDGEPFVCTVTQSRVITTVEVTTLSDLSVNRCR
jgi:hypothetical protein